MKYLLVLFILISQIDAKPRRCYNSVGECQKYEEGEKQTVCEYYKPPRYTYKRYKGTKYKKEIKKCTQWIYVDGDWREVVR